MGGIEGVLAAHQTEQVWKAGGWAGDTACSCGWRMAMWSRKDFPDVHRAHVADALREWLLSEAVVHVAARALSDSQNPAAPQAYRNYREEWVRDARAALTAAVETDRASEGDADWPCATLTALDTAPAPTDLDAVRREVPCWRSECRTGCYYGSDLCGEKPAQPPTPAPESRCEHCGEQHERGQCPALHVPRADGMNLCEYDDEDWPCAFKRGRSGGLR